MLTISKLARQAGIARSSLLYYERIGLLQPKLRGDNGYRWYGPEEVTRLESIMAYRSYGIAIDKIGELLDRNSKAQADILKEHFQQLDLEIKQLRQQQKAIIELLHLDQEVENDMVNKDTWVAIMRGAGLSDDDMTRWHQTFEKMEPEEHQKFLESLGIEQDEIAQIRKL
ncbi:MerR family transcriptional regulator [Pseudoteredinibacter isoporae]|uniref:DNA-binding transcriptional MerR regulator n=1 Tax=Pseudoteredinibacter isoporae TaxID=570281 RepID=A0A7X0JUB6_9GAMM|nr:MerR family transcriptional regulator [Pseudoteredinibacter isoporae]MBB6522307.1 DNA-binding transcriptional MerR regulator [Pseudoteredinibacter isoporae]NHO87840.1 MerR family transcriptional regulator [Pseudoteredinibacter isoporae]NIB23829.1 MerR family transcriptional regulator [Pseudoteredinibacter isoporae]